MEAKIIQADFSQLNLFVKALSDTHVVNVGIFGRKSGRKEKGGMSNADVGFIHEFGGPKMPKRSFLRMPLYLKSEDILARVVAAGALKKLAMGKMVGVLRDLGISCEAAILAAFDSGGFGSWLPLARSTIRRKGSSAVLIDTGQLRRSIASEVAEK